MKFLYTGLFFVSCISFVSLNVKGQSTDEIVDESSGLTRPSTSRLTEKANTSLSQRPTKKSTTKNTAEEISIQTTETSSFTYNKTLTDEEILKFSTRQVDSEMKAIERIREKMKKETSEYEKKLAAKTEELSKIKQSIPAAAKSLEESRKKQAKAVGGNSEDFKQIFRTNKEGYEEVELSTSSAELVAANANLKSLKDSLFREQSNYTKIKKEYEAAESRGEKIISLKQANVNARINALENLNQKLNTVSVTHEATILNSDILTAEMELRLLEYKYDRALIGVYVTKKIHDLLDSKTLCESIKSCIGSDTKCNDVKNCISGKANVNEKSFDELFNPSFKNLKNKSDGKGTSFEINNENSTK